MGGPVRRVAGQVSREQEGARGTGAAGEFLLGLLWTSQCLVRVIDARFWTARVAIEVPEGEGAGHLHSALLVSNAYASQLLFCLFDLFSVFQYEEYVILATLNNCAVRCGAVRDTEAALLVSARS